MMMMMMMMVKPLNNGQITRMVSTTKSFPRGMKQLFCRHFRHSPPSHGKSLIFSSSFLISKSSLTWDFYILGMSSKS